jgi:hypothetical protein
VWDIARVEQRPNELRDGVTVNAVGPGTRLTRTTRARVESASSYLVFLGLAPAMIVAFAVRIVDGSIAPGQLLVGLWNVIQGGACRSCKDVPGGPDGGPWIGAALAALALGTFVSYALGEALGSLGQTLGRPGLTRLSDTTGSMSALAAPFLAYLYYDLAPDGQVAIDWTLRIAGVLLALLFGSAIVWFIAMKVRHRI